MFCLKLEKYELSWSLLNRTVLKWLVTTNTIKPKFKNSLSRIIFALFRKVTSLVSGNNPGDTKDLNIFLNYTKAKYTFALANNIEIFCDWRIRCQYNNIKQSKCSPCEKNKQRYESDPFWPVKFCVSNNCGSFLNEHRSKNLLIISFLWNWKAYLRKAIQMHSWLVLISWKFLGQKTNSQIASIIS